MGTKLDRELQELAAAQAAKEIEKSKPARVDFLELALAGKLPMRPAYWGLLVEPFEPPNQSEGGIVFTNETRMVSEIQTNCARVLAMGPGACSGKTSSGIDLSRIADEINDPKELIGKWIIYQKHTGQASLLRRPVYGKRLLNISDGEILDIIDSPTDFIYWI